MRINNRGAASILVILIIVVLATFGGIALTAGWTNKQLSIKAAQSKANYYALDSVAEEVVAQVDNLLYASAEDATKYLNNLPGIEAITDLEKEGKLSTLFSPKTEYINSAILKTKKISEVFVRNYYYNCALRLEKYAKENGLVIKYSDSFGSAVEFLDSENPIPKLGDLTLIFTVSEGEASGAKSIDAEIAINAPDIQAQVGSDEKWQIGFIIEQNDSVQRFEILSWKLRHNPIEYDDENPKFG